MPALIVSYDLNKPGQNYDILTYLKANYSWAKLSESAYAIATSKTPATVFSELEQFKDQNDQIYVVTLKQPHAGWGPKAVNDWLEKNLSY